MVDALVDTSTAVMTFNNRGFEQIGEIKRKVETKSKYVLAGAAHEIFNECADDIQGAVNFAKKTGAKGVYLAGHSTGCQKAFYWASKNAGGKGVKGIILFGPLSDYSGALATKGASALSKGVAYARKLVATGKPHELMPKHLGEWFECDAQRFLSLYTAESVEDVFPYATGGATKTMKKVRVPVLTLLAGAD